MRILAAACIVMLAGFMIKPALAEKRVALVIGNGAYQYADKLANPVTDARAMRDELGKLGFKVVYGENLGRQQLELEIGTFADAVQDADVALVYFAGHGATFADIPYVVPVDAQFASLSQMPYVLVPVETLIGELRRAKGLRIAILDACRDDSAERELKRVATRGAGEITRGLARVANPEGLILAYATQYLATAADGDPTGDSPFTAALLDNIGTPGLDVKDLFYRVGAEVVDKTMGHQRPEISISFYDPYTLVPAGQAAPAPAAPPAQDQAALAWAEIKDSKNANVLQEFIRRFGDSFYATIARARLEELKSSQVAVAAPSTVTPEAPRPAPLGPVASLPPTAPQPATGRPDGAMSISDADLFKEVRERLYELNFDPGPFDGPITDVTRQAIREFQQQNKLAATGLATQGLLQRLRDVGPLKPWGAIVYAKDTKKWGMSWDTNTRADAVANARASCGDPTGCSTEVSFFGSECAAFAHSDASWSITAREGMANARQAALSDCGKRGKTCQIVAAVCAGGAERFTGAK